MNLDKYNFEQIMELYAGTLSKVDISIYADPKIPSDKMAEMRSKMEEEIGYEHTYEDIAKLDSLAYERKFQKEMRRRVQDWLDRFGKTGKTGTEKKEKEFIDITDLIVNGTVEILTQGQNFYLVNKKTGTSKQYKNHWFYEKEGFLESPGLVSVKYTRKSWR